MKIARRSFIRRSGAGMAALAAGACGVPATTSEVGSVQENYEVLDRVLAQPVLKRELFSTPVMIERVELLHRDGSYLCRVRSTDGAEGISVAHNTMRMLYPIFLEAVAPFFVGKDACELDLILEKVFIYKLNFRLSGLALGIPLATVEFAVLDMLGKIAGKSIGQLIGDIHHPRVPVYQATEYRELPVEESLELIKRDVAEYQANAVKIKVGGLMFMTDDMYAEGPPGRTETMIPLVRETFGDEMALYADANGFYGVEDAVRVGRMLEEYDYGFFEEPVMFDWYEETKQVADALSIPVAGGEQEYNLHGFRRLLASDGLQVVQPDNYYFGGLIRSLKVARMAEAMGKQCTPHMSGGGLGYLYMIHFVSALPNAFAHHEFKGLDTSIEFTCDTSNLQVEDGALKVPTGPGLGIEMVPGFVEGHRPV